MALDAEKPERYRDNTPHPNTSGKWNSGIYFQSGGNHQSYSTVHNNVAKSSLLRRQSFIFHLCIVFSNRIARRC